MYSSWGKVLYAERVGYGNVHVGGGGGLVSAKETWLPTVQL